MTTVPTTPVFLFLSVPVKESISGKTNSGKYKQQKISSGGSQNGDLPAIQETAALIAQQLPVFLIPCTAAQVQYPFPPTQHLN